MTGLGREVILLSGTQSNGIFSDPESFAYAFYGMTLKELIEHKYREFTDPKNKICAPGDQPIEHI